MGLSRGVNDMQPFAHELQPRTQLGDGDVEAVHVDPLDVGFKGFEPLPLLGDPGIADRTCPVVIDAGLRHQSRSSE